MQKQSSQMRNGQENGRAGGKPNATAPAPPKKKRREQHDRQTA